MSKLMKPCHFYPRLIWEYSCVPNTFFFFSRAVKLWPMHSLVKTKYIYVYFFYICTNYKLAGVEPDLCNICVVFVQHRGLFFNAFLGRVWTLQDSPALCLFLPHPSFFPIRITRLTPEAFECAIPGLKSPWEIAFSI